MAKAEAIARSLNGKIVRVVETREGGTPELSRPDPYSADASTNTMTAAKTDYRTPVQAGQVNLKAEIVMVVEIET
jgi:uncharacterized protein YggE